MNRRAADEGWGGPWENSGASRGAEEDGPWKNLRGHTDRCIERTVP